MVLGFQTATRNEDLLAADASQLQLDANGKGVGDCERLDDGSELRSVRAQAIRSKGDVGEMEFAVLSHDESHRRPTTIEERDGHAVSRPSVGPKDGTDDRARLELGRGA